MKWTEDEFSFLFDYPNCRIITIRLFLCIEITSLAILKRLKQAH
jgi:hypothetical protein